MVPRVRLKGELRGKSALTLTLSRKRERGKTHTSH